jgi:exosortase K
MPLLQSGFLVVLLLIAAATKGLAMLEFAPLYHTLLFLPAKIAVLVSGESYIEFSGIYRFHSFVLDYSCAGVNFLLLCLAAGAWHFRQSVQSLPQLLRTSALLLLAAWFTTNLANTFRIGLSLKLFHHHAQHAWLHEAVGTIVFITFLLGYYQLILRFTNDKAQTAQ